MLGQLPAAAQLPLFSILALRVGVLAAMLGCFLGFIDVYDRQYRAAAYLLVTNVALGIGIPILLALGSLGMISMYN